MKKKLLGWLKNDTETDVPPPPPGWQPASLTLQVLQSLDKSVDALLKDAPPVRDIAAGIARRFCDRVRVLPGARSGPWGLPGGGIARLTQVFAALYNEKSILSLPPDWRLALFLVVTARALRTLHGVEVEYQDGHLWDPLSGPPSRPWRWRLREPRYPDSDWQTALWLVVDLLPEGGFRLLMGREDVYSQLVSALTLRDQGQGLLSQLAECAEKQAREGSASWPDMSCACETVADSTFGGKAQETDALCHPHQARLNRLDRESGMTTEARYIWNTLPLKQFLTLVQNVPATPDGVYSEAGGLATLVCDALQIAVRIRKSCALPPDDPEEQMRQGEAWNTAVWFTVLFLGLERLYHIRIFRRQGLNWQPWFPENGPLPAGAVYRGYFEHNPDAAVRALPVLYTLMPPEMLSWFRPFPLLFRTFTGALAGHTSGLLIRKIAEDALQKASEQWLRDSGLPVTPDAGVLTLPPASSECPVPPGSPAVTTGSDAPADNTPPPAKTPPPVTSSSQPVTQPITAIDSLLTQMASAPAEPPVPTGIPDVTATVVKENAPENDTGDMADSFIVWLKAGISDGTLAVNTPDALIHVWSPGFAFIECPAIVQRWARNGSGTPEERDKLWRNVLRQLRSGHFFHETNGRFPEGRVSAEDGSFRNVKGHLISPQKLFAGNEIPSPGRYFTLRK
ncbi:TraI domain-containing protein [Klebsiella quasivariicola]|uniref:TraI domain-containing protein n=1 Tax=Klebsiella quasivariicola TaxID=2026240 RepID=UPI00247ABC3D|nr:TraI domain-containing protein [Klebsiella quasivariicola]